MSSGVVKGGGLLNFTKADNSPMDPDKSRKVGEFFKIIRGKEDNKAPTSHQDVLVLVGYGYVLPTPGGFEH